MARIRRGRNKFRLVSPHRENCAACAVVQSGEKVTVWMTPQLEDEQVFYVCADPDCGAKLAILDVASIRLPKY